MSTLAWIRRQRDRPIAEHERQVAMAVVVAFLTAIGLLLALTQPSSRPARHSTSTSATHPRQESQIPPGAPAPLTSAASRAAGAFLTGYLGYIYGHRSAREVTGATATFTHSLSALAPRVPPSMRARLPRVLALRPARAPAGLTGVTAVVNDGGLVDYPITLYLAPRGRRLLVTGVGGA
jgi:hypothetical protein